MKFREELDKYYNLTKRIISNSNYSLRYIGLNNILSQIEEIIIEKYDIDYTTDIHLKFDSFYHNVYYLLDDEISESLNFVIRYYENISEYLKDTNDKFEERLEKLKQLSHIVYSNKIEKIIHHQGVKCYDEVVYAEDLDRIYYQNGSYRKYYTLKDNRYFKLFWSIFTKSKFDNIDDFKEFCKIVLLAIILHVEINVLHDEMELIGIDIPSMRNENSKVMTLLEKTKFQKVLRIAKEEGFVDIKGKRYEWKGKLRELVRFSELAFENQLTKDKWDTIEALFCKKNLAQEKSKFYKGILDSEERIEKCFK